MSYRGGSQNLGKPELEKVMQRRKLDAEGKAGSIRGDQLTVGGRTTANDELAAQLSRRSYLLEEVCVCVRLCVCVGGGCMCVSVASFPGLHAQLLLLAVRKVGGRPGQIYHVMRATADVTFSLLTSGFVLSPLLFFP